MLSIPKRVNLDWCKKGSPDTFHLPGLKLSRRLARIS
jgi:hypothetical protein